VKEGLDRQPGPGQRGTDTAPGARPVAAETSFGDVEILALVTIVGILFLRPKRRGREKNAREKWDHDEARHGRQP
jgi:hypothetical protein